jgi:3-isopropylmalate dehydrogenase
MLLRSSLGRADAADAIDAAVAGVLGDGLRTADVAAGGSAVGTRAMADAIARRIAATTGVAA